MSNCIANIATNVFHIGNIIVKNFISCTIAGSFAASFLLTNNRVAPVSIIAGTAKPLV